MSNYSTFVSSPVMTSRILVTAIIMPPIENHALRLNYSFKA